MPRTQAPLWPLPFAIAAVMTTAVHVAWWLSVRDGHVQTCIPYLEGCTSISRAARHGFGNHVFRLLMLPCALLVGVHWWLARRWLQQRGAAGMGIALLGGAAAVALAVYATFLGSDGEAYRFLRRYGVVVYFGCSYLAQLLFLRAARRQGRVRGRVAATMLAICVAMLLLGIVNVAAGVLLAHDPLKDRLENLLEWHLGVLLVGWFLLQAWLWRRSGYGVDFAVGEASPETDTAPEKAAR